MRVTRAYAHARKSGTRRTAGKDARTAEEREGATDAAAGSDGRDTKMRVARSRWTQNSRHGVALLRAKGAKKSSLSRSAMRRHPPKPA